VGIQASLETVTPCRLQVRVDEPGRTSHLVYESPDPLWDDAPTTLDFVAVALAQYASAAGEPLHVHGPVTQRQLEHLDEYVQIWSGWRPDLYRRVTITADEECEVPPGPPQASAVMAFSGGVDASFALAAHAGGELGRLSRPVGRGVLVQGFDLRPGDDEGLARARASATRSLRHYGAETSVVTTNWKQELCAAWFMSFNAGVVAVLQTLSDRHSCAVYATDHSYAEELRMGPYGSHLSINHLLGHPGFPVVSTGGTHARIDRLAYLAAHPVLLEGLRVCYQPDAAGGNCGRCEKCVRTQLEMRAVGVDPGAAFPTRMSVEDLERAEPHRPAVLMHYDDVLRRLPADDPYVPLLRTWVRDWRLAQAREAGLPLARVDALQRERTTLQARVDVLEQQLAEQQERTAAAEVELATRQGSRSWRWTAPLRG
jgi:hypothetical protein